MYRIFYVSLFLCLLTACVSFQTSKNPVEKASYNLGYQHGCRSGVDISNSQGTLDQDLIPRTLIAGRYQSDAAYRSGWNAGFHVCKRK